MEANTNIKDISANNDLGFYQDKTNVGRQELVTSTVDYIKTIAKDLFEPLEFLNLLWKQKQFVNENHKNPRFVIDTLKSLPLADAQRHVLYCFLLKWYGGYPVEAFLYNMDNDDLIPNVYKSIEKEFLRYEGDTPEKEYCSRSCSEHELIDVIHHGTLFGIRYIDWWANGKAGGFVYDERQNCYRFVEMEYNRDRNMYERLSPYNTADLTNLPIRARGFTAFLIHKWGKFEKGIDCYDAYYKPLLEKYKRKEQVKPGSLSRNLEKEFYVKHIWNEQKNIKYSKSLLFDFLRVHDVEIIQSYIDEYFRHIRNYSPPIPTYANMNELRLLLLKSAYESKDYQINIDYFKCLANVTNNDIHKTENDMNKLKTLCEGYGTFAAGYGDLSWSQFTLNDVGFKYYENTLEKERNKATIPAEQSQAVQISQPKTSKTNGEEAERTIDSERLKEYFSGRFKGMGGSINYFDTMIEELKTDRTGKEFAQIAYMIHRSGKMNDRKPEPFAKWYKIFCECIGINPSNGYKPNNLNEPSEALKKLFNYL
jgi:hypothetical protein